MENGTRNSLRALGGGTVLKLAGITVVPETANQQIRMTPRNGAEQRVEQTQSYNPFSGQVNTYDYRNQRREENRKNHSQGHKGSTTTTSLPAYLIASSPSTNASIKDDFLPRHLNLTNCLPTLTLPSHKQLPGKTLGPGE